jgi:hypothetical protein
MDQFAGLDVSVKETSVCIVDDTGRIVREVKVASEPEALLQVLGNPAYRFKRIGLEAGPLSWGVGILTANKYRTISAKVTLSTARCRQESRRRLVPDDGVTTHLSVRCP